MSSDRVIKQHVLAKVFFLEYACTVFEDITKPNVRGLFCRNHEQTSCSTLKTEIVFVVIVVMAFGSVSVSFFIAIKSKHVCGYVDRKELSVFFLYDPRTNDGSSVSTRGVSARLLRSAPGRDRHIDILFLLRRRTTIIIIKCCRQHPIIAVSQYAVCDEIETGGWKGRGK